MTLYREPGSGSRVDGTSRRKDTADDYGAFFRGLCDERGFTLHYEFSRCPGCDHATVAFRGPIPPWAINHAQGCAMPEKLPRPAQRRDSR